MNTRSTTTANDRLRMRCRNRHQRGLTLIELTVAMAILVMMVAGAALTIGSLIGSKAKAATGELGGIIRSLYDTATLSGKTCRLVFELPKENSDAGGATYRAECAAGAVTASRDREEELRDANQKKEKGNKDKRFRSLGNESTYEQLMMAEKNRVEDSAKFSNFTSSEIEARTLPESVSLEIWTRPLNKKVKTGVVYLYFFPQGFTERAQIYVRQGNNVWTLSVAPLTGKTSVEAEELEVPRI